MAYGIWVKKIRELQPVSSTSTKPPNASRGRPSVLGPRSRSDLLLKATDALPAPELGHFVPVAAHRIAAPLTPVVLGRVVENDATGFGVGTVTQILKVCRDQEFGDRPGENRKSRIPASKDRFRPIQMKDSFPFHG